MATNLALDDNLINQAQKIGGFKTKRETVTHALEDFIKHKKQEEIISLFGSVEFDQDYDYKKMRK